MTSEVTGVLRRLQRLLPKIEKEEERRRNWDHWLHSTLSGGLNGAGEEELREVLAKRHSVPARRSRKVAPSTKRGPMKLSLRRRHELKLHGEYIGRMKYMTEREKARVKAVREKEGYRSALALAKQLKKEREG